MIGKLHKIFNWKEYITFFFTLFFIKCSFLHYFNFNTKLDFFCFLLLCIASIGIVATGDFLIYFNAKKEISEKSKRKRIKKISGLLFLFCILTILYVLIKTNNIIILFIYLLLISVTLFHAIKNHKKTLLNNIITSSYIPLSIIFLWYIDFPIDVTISQWKIILQLEVILLYAIIVSFFGSLNKNLLIDLKNKKSDLQKKHKTLPIVFGDKQTKKIMTKISITCHFTTILLISLFLINVKISYIIILVLYLHMTIHQLFFNYYLKKCRNKKDYKKLINLVNLMLTIGVFIFPFMAYLIKNVIK